MNRPIHITGASGSGTTTLGANLAKALGCAHFDTDDYYWLPTDPPFQIKRDIPERLQMLRAALGESHAWVLSGSLGEWGNPLVTLFTVVVFLKTPTGIRLHRLRQREAERFGSRAIQAGGARYDQHREFLDWAAAYDYGTMPGRSLSRHEAWLAKISCPVVVADGAAAPEELARDILARIAR